VKNLSLPISIVVAVVGCALAVNAYITSGNMRQNLEEERYKRMSAEENLQNTKSEVAKIRADLAAAQQTLTSIQDLVSKGSSANSGLRTQLDAVTQERDALKQQLEKIQVTDVIPQAAPAN